MAKFYPQTKENKKLNVSNTLFVNVLKNEDGAIKQASIINMLSPIKCEIIYNKYVSSGNKKSKNMLKEDKYACESELSEVEIVEELKEILYSKMNKNKSIWSFESNFEDIIECKSIQDYYDLDDFQYIVDFFSYKKNDDLDYSADLTDSLVQNIFSLSYLFMKNNFV